VLSRRRHVRERSQVRYGFQWVLELVRVMIVVGGASGIGGIDND
jgi:hypothetical protein